jgi:Transglutaminase-like superfamily
MMAISPAYHELIKRLPATEKARLTVEILGTYVRARLLLTRHGLPAAVESLRAVELRRGAEPPQNERIAQAAGVRLGMAVCRVLAILPTDSRCLVRSLVLTRLLAKRGIGSAFVIGVRPAPNFHAHAWIESNGVPLLSPLDVGDERLLEL